MAELTRREAMGLVGAVAVGTAVGRSMPLSASAQGTVNEPALRQAISRWGFQNTNLTRFLQYASDTGLRAVDMLKEEEWLLAAKCGLTCVTGYGGGGTVTNGLSNTSNHNEIVRNLERSIPHASRVGVPNIITFFGNRQGISTAQGIDNCVQALRRIAPIAENENVTILAELLNSRVDYPDYIGDRTAFGVEVVKRVNSPRIKLLYDIYHMQMMEGNVIQTIADNQQHIAHYHTAGVPGRGGLGVGQELNWKAISRSIARTGYSGYIAHEFIATGDPVRSIREAVSHFSV